jgi:hypothetical protein
LIENLVGDSDMGHGHATCKPRIPDLRDVLRNA